MPSVSRQAVAGAGSVRAPGASLGCSRFLPLASQCGVRTSDFRARSSNFALLTFSALGVLCALLLSTAAPAQSLLSDAVTARSVSGQFIVHASGSLAPPEGLAALATNRSFVLLEPSLVPTSCERIKQFLLRELGAPARWRGKIFVTLRPATTTDEPVTLVSDQFRDGWQYRLDLPNLVERSRYVRAVVQALLLEMANRSADVRSAELPPWLVEGFTRQLLASKEIEMILPPPQKRTATLNVGVSQVDARWENPLEAAHKVLLAHPGLTFQELSWPGDQLAGEAGEVYGSSAQLFVNELLQLKDGRVCLRAMLEELPRHYNWQFAFLHAFQAFFPRPLEVEKWWALQLARFTGRDLRQTWAADESWQKLNQVIRSSVQIRTSTNELPLRADVALQTIILEWDHEAQIQALQSTVRQLQWLRLRAATNHVGLVSDYCQVLQAYLQKRDHTGLVPFRKKIVQRHAAQEAVQQLDALDARRLGLAPSEGRKPSQTAAKAALP